MTLELSLFNPTDADLVAARIVLRDSFLFEDYGTFEPVSIKAGLSITVRGHFNIPRREYDLWQKGRQPNFFLEFGDTSEIGVGQKLALLLRRTGRRRPSLNNKTPEPAVAGERLRVTSQSSTLSHRLMDVPALALAAGINLKARPSWPRCRRF